MNENRHINAAEFLRKVPPFSELPTESLDSFLPACRFREFSAHELIFVEGELGESGFLVALGRVAMIKGSPSGKELIIELLPAGELFGVIVLLEDRPYPLTARAQNACQVLTLPKAAIRDLIRLYPEFQAGLFRIIANRLRSSHNVSRALAHDRVEVRIASALCALVPTNEGNETGTVEIEIGRQELADLTGTTIETASRVVKGLEKNSILDLSRMGIVRIIDFSALAAILDECAN